MEKRALKYKVVIHWDEISEDFLASCPELGNCAVRAKTQEQALALVGEAIERHLRELEERHLPLPIPFSRKRFSGKILIRIDPALHRNVAMQAAMEGISMSRFIENKLRRH